MDPKTAEAEMGLDLHPPDGMVYEWKVETVKGEPISHGQIIDIHIARWRPVPPERHPGHAVNLFGLCLMERSKVDCENFHREMFTRVKAQETMPNETLALYCRPGFTPLVNPSDGDLILTEEGWLPAELY